MTRSKTQKRKVSELIFDQELYPRGDVSSYNITQIGDAISAGEPMPPIVVDQMNKIIDGVHRWRAYQRLFKDDHEIRVEVREYESDADRYLDAARLNAKHGLKLDRHDHVRCLLQAEKLSIADVDLAAALGCTVDKLASLRETRTAIGRNGHALPLKQTIRHMAGRKLTVRQEQANVRLSGMNAVFYVNQLIDLLEADLINPADRTLQERLQVLDGLLSAHLGATSDA